MPAFQFPSSLLDAHEFASELKAAPITVPSNLNTDAQLFASEPEALKVPSYETTDALLFASELKAEISEETGFDHFAKRLNKDKGRIECITTKSWRARAYVCMYPLYFSSLFSQFPTVTFLYRVKSENSANQLLNSLSSRSQ